MKSPLLAAALVMAPLPVLAQTSPTGFLSPSKNIACQYFPDGKNSVIRCDIMQATVSVPKPRDCELEWGRAFEIGVGSKSGIRICHGDTIMDPKLRVLNYDATFQHGGFTCKSEPSGVTCFNAGRHGFSIARGRQEVF